MTPNTRTTKRAGDDSLHAGLDCYAPPRKRRSAPFESNSTQSDTQRDQLEHNLQDQLDTCNYTAPLPQPIPVRPRKSLPKPVSILATTKGLDLEQVRELDQNPEGKDYFPQPYSPLAVDLPITDADSVPDDAKDPACHRYTAWCIQEIRKARASNIIARMMADPSLTIKWNLYLRRTWKNRELVLKELQLAPSHTTNHEAAYGALVGIVLPPAMNCEACQKGNGPFRCCIVVPGYLNGACTGCHYNSSGRKCSHRIMVPTKRTGAKPVPPTVLTKSTPTKGKRHRSGSDEILFVSSRSIKADHILYDIIDKIQLQLIELRARIHARGEIEKPDHAL